VNQHRQFSQSEIDSATLKHSSIAENATTIAVRACPNHGRSFDPLLQHTLPELQMGPPHQQEQQSQKSSAF